MAGARPARRVGPAALALAALLVLSGCAAPVAGPDALAADRDRGHVGGYAPDDDLDVDASDGLTAAELEAVKYRSMARIEVLRGLKFAEDVEIEVITREAYRERRGERGPASPFTNELWRGAFVVDGETDVDAALEEVYGDAVVGYYRSGEIVIVADDPDGVVVDRRTLVHELVHALQDQRFGLDRRGSTLDERRAETGVFEGEADYVAHLYDRRCGDEWECLPEVEPAPRDPERRPFNAGLFLSIYAPYAEGPSFVAHHRERGGWDAVDALHEDRPRSTSQVIHPERYPDDGPREVAVEDRSTDAWEPFADGDGGARTETVGEATLFAALWVNGAVDRPLTAGGTALSPYDYSDPATDGWAGDSFVAYHASDDENRTGHVWALEFETDADAAEFADAYREVVENAGGEAVDGDAYRVADGRAFEGAYRIDVDGDRVTVVGAPTVDDLGAIRPEGAAPALEGPAAAAPTATAPSSPPSAAAP
ncbi:Hvo_1808 family surface protein [Salinilacihabitans rarus]|uniref:Hvo_1808 family surface protein n=1 Tax=Salinilacihabitans rarus TaxID=2961596 RepID=UPI0020C8F015|nr:Hvo_1808 family surface protein [Salinilacihabitans rarus]